MSQIEQQNFANKPRNRRAVVKGAAWSVPVIAAAIAAPAASASGTGVLTVSTANCNGLEIATNPAFVLTAVGDSSVETTFTITSSKVVDASLQDAWTDASGISVVVLSGNTWTFTIPPLAANASVTLQSNAALVSLLSSYTGTAASSGSSKTMSLTLGLLGLVTLCTTS